MSAVETDGGEVRAEHEVVVCAGAIDSPKLLMLSGIGRADALARLEIEVVVRPAGSRGEPARSPARARRLLVDASGAPGRAGDSGLHAHLFDRSKPGLAVPDTQPLFFHVPAYEPWMEGPPDAYTLMGALVRPESRGTLTLASADPDDPPLIDAAFLAEEADVDVLEWSFNQVREIGAGGRDSMIGAVRSSTPARP